MQPKIRKAFFKTSKCYILYNSMYIVDHSLSHVWLFVTPWTAAHQAPLSLTVSWSLLKLMSIELMMPSNQLIFCCLLRLPSIFSQHQDLFQCVSFSHQVAKVLELQLQHQPFSEYSGLISLGWTGWISLQCKGLSRVFSSTPTQKHQFFSAQPSLWSSSHICTWLLVKS